MDESTIWPPSYHLRYSRRAKHIQLRIVPRKGLEVVIPSRASRVDIQNVLNAHRPWILNKMPEILAAEQHAQLPTQFELCAINQRWLIEYIAAPGDWMLWPQGEKKLCLRGDVDDTQRCQYLLKRWLLRQGKKHLVPWLKRVSTMTGLTVNRISIRDQRTRWGSCNSQRAISLNCRLLFLPPELVTYVCVHELCHTVHMDHSRHFWQLVSQFDPDWKLHRSQLKKYQQLIPQ